MLIVLKPDISQKNLDEIVKRIESIGCKAHILKGQFRSTINVLGDDVKVDPDDYKKLEGVLEVLTVMKPFRLVSREFKKEDTIVDVNGVKIGGENFTIIGGPCAVESKEQALRIAKAVKKSGAHIIRGGAYKPRSSPYSFQGMGEEGLKILQDISKEVGLPIITEALDSKSLEAVYKYADIIQIGTRNMQNFSLLKEAGKLDKPVMLKRGMSATIDEWLMAAEYIMSGGNHNVMLCERGIRSFDDTYTRNVVDLGCIPAVRSLSHLPIVIDPSHGTGRRDAIAPMTFASIAVGAHAVMIDVHDDPANAKCDGAQAISPEAFESIVGKVKKISPVLERKVK